MQPNAPAPTETSAANGSAGAPVVDVTPPQPSVALSPQIPPAADTEIKPAPPEESSPSEPAPNQDIAKPLAVTKKPKVVKTPSNGAGMIVLLTLLAMIVLSAIAVFAYLQSK